MTQAQAPEKDNSTLWLLLIVCLLVVVLPTAWMLYDKRSRRIKRDANRLEFQKLQELQESAEQSAY